MQKRKEKFPETVLGEMPFVIFYSYVIFINLICSKPLYLKKILSIIH